jgi:GT2 family glycosyltransferase
VDLSFRAQLAGWKVLYQPKAVAYHRIGETSGRIKGFTVYQTFKNLPMMIIKNVPKGLGNIIYPRFILAYTSFFLSALARGDGWHAFKGFSKFLSLLPKKLGERRKIQSGKKVSNEYIYSILTHDLPENSTKLRKLRAVWQKLQV